jgi:hypothetical protein
MSNTFGVAKLPAPVPDDFIKVDGESYKVRGVSSDPYVIIGSREFKIYQLASGWSYDTDAMVAAASAHEAEAARLHAKLINITRIAPRTLCVDGVVDKGGTKYVGIATKMPNGMWQCLAIVGDALCLVEAQIITTPPDGDGDGDGEGDRGR